MKMRRCECGVEVEYDGYNTIEIEEGFFRIEGDAICPSCNKEYFYTEFHRLDFNNPFEVELEENNG